MAAPVQQPQQPSRLIRRREVENRTGLARSSIYDLIRAGRFPAPVRLTESTVAWVEQEVDDFIAERIAARSAA